MKSFKMNDWVKGALAQSKRVVSKIQLRSLTETIKDRQPLHHTVSILRTYRIRLLKGVGALGLLASISIGGNQYVKLHTNEVFHVYVGGQEAGTVSDPKVVEEFIVNKYKELEENNPDVHMVLNSEDVTYKSEKAFNIQSDDTAALERVGQLLTAKAVGVDLVVNGKVIGVVKDKETANQILEQIKSKYVPQKKESGGVMALSAKAEPQQPGETVIQSVDFMEKVDLNTREIKPEELMKPEDVLKKLETGDVAPTKYVVQKGDCVSCIAKKMGISKALIYEKNPWIQDDKIKVGQELDLTVLKPALTVKTVEKVVENQEIQYPVVYEKDDTMRAGQTKVIKPGKNGLKKVTFLVTKANGLPVEEEFVEEQVLQEPETEIAKKGTKVVLGEGTGKFVWPVLGAKITSSFGMRWGKMHKGIDITGNRNIMAADNGIVTFVGDKNDGYGNMIIIDHQNGYRTVYAHLSQFSTSRGKVVEKGEKIGVMGDTGDSTGVHLHFEVQRNGIPENPMKFLSR